MIEINFKDVRFGVSPMSDDKGREGKQLAVIDADSGLTYLLPLSQEAADILSADLAATNEELERKIQQAQLEAQLQVRPEEAEAVRDGRVVDLSQVRTDKK